MLENGIIKLAGDKMKRPKMNMSDDDDGTQINAHLKWIARNGLFVIDIWPFLSHAIMKLNRKCKRLTAMDFSFLTSSIFRFSFLRFFSWLPKIENWSGTIRTLSFYLNEHKTKVDWTESSYTTWRVSYRHFFLPRSPQISNIIKKIDRKSVCNRSNKTWYLSSRFVLYLWTERDTIAYTRAHNRLVQSIQLIKSFLSFELLSSFTLHWNGQHLMRRMERKTKKKREVEDKKIDFVWFFLEAMKDERRRRRPRLCESYVSCSADAQGQNRNNNIRVIKFNGSPNIFINIWSWFGRRRTTEGKIIRPMLVDILVVLALWEYFWIDFRSLLWRLVDWSAAAFEFVHSVWSTFPFDRQSSFYRLNICQWNLYRIKMYHFEFDIFLSDMHVMFCRRLLPVSVKMFCFDVNCRLIYPSNSQHCCQSVYLFRLNFTSLEIELSLFFFSADFESSRSQHLLESTHITRRHIFLSSSKW